MPLGTKDSSAIKFDRVEIAFILSLVLLADPLTDEGVCSPRLGHCSSSCQCAQRAGRAGHETSGFCVAGSMVRALVEGTRILTGPDGW